MIPVNEPVIGSKEIAYVNEALRTGWISSAGRFIDEFEQRFAEYCGMEHAVAVANGTVALQLAISCLDLEPGGEIIMPTFTIVSCALAAVYNGLHPVLVDCDPETWCMDVEQVEARISDRTRAIMPVHIYGHPVDMDPVREIAERHGLVVVEDAAEAHGAEYKGRRCGGLGDLSCFSFYANKIITTGEGGMVLTRDAGLAALARSRRNLCFSEERRFWHTDLGHNCRLTNLQAAIGLGQMERIEELISVKRRMAARYNEGLAGLPVQLPTEREWARSVYWMYGIVLDDCVGMDAAELARRLADAGVQTRPFFVGMHEQPVFRGMGLFAGERYPVAERIARQGLYLPSGMALSGEQLEQTVRAVRTVLA